LSLPQGDRTVLANALLGILLPAGTAALVLCLAWPRRGRALRAWGPPLVLGLAFATGYVATHGWPPLPPLGIKHWIFYAGLFGGLYGAYEALAERPRAIWRVLLAAGAPYFFLGFMREHHWTRTQALLWTVGLALWTYGSWLGLEALARRLGGAMLPLALALAIGLGAGALHLAGASTLAQLAGALAVPLAMLSLGAGLKPETSLAPGGLAPLVLVHLGLVWAARFAAELGAASFVLLSLAPLLSWCGALVPGAGRRTRAALSVLPPSMASLGALLIEGLSRPVSP
jgi:hypothetical protein